MITVKDIFDFIDSFAPFETQESWDNSGMLIGDISKEVNTVAVCLDITPETIENAKINGADLIVSHHPVIFNPVSNVLKGSPVYMLLESDLSAICAHTNLDIATGGVNDVLAQLLELEDISVLQDKDNTGILRIGKTKKSTPLDFAKLVSEKLGTTVRIAKGGRDIETVAVCGGSGCSFIPDVIASGIDAFVTGDAKHNDFLDAGDNCLTLVVAGHYETENPAMPVLAKLLHNQFPTISVLYMDSNPAEYINF
ncbi:MAG: Nif3-like dinuclear metal center hexameric protein [Oscillospiraceae bacterium]